MSGARFTMLSSRLPRIVIFWASSIPSCTIPAEGLTVPINSQNKLFDPYHLPNYCSEFTPVITNKRILTPYRGAGRQHDVFVMEQLFDLAARQLGLDINEVCRWNYIPKVKRLYENVIIFQDFQPLADDSGNNEPSPDKVLYLIGYDEYRQNSNLPHLQQAAALALALFPTIRARISDATKGQE